MQDLLDKNRVPLKQYNLIVTGDNSFVLNRAVGVPYQTMDGAWRLRFNINGTMASTVTELLTIQGIVTGPASQACSARMHASAYCVAYMTSIGNTINLTTGTATTNLFVSSDVELSSKPTFVQD